MSQTIGTQISSDQIRPFKVNVPEAELTELRRALSRASTLRQSYSVVQ